MSRIAAAVVLLLLCTPARADEVNSYLESRMRQLHIPGLAVAVVRDGKVVKSKGYGLANVELAVPVTEETVFEIGSITKQFTAAAVMMLVEEGRIALDDPIGKHLSGVPEAWSAVTVRHLLTHSSGIQNYLDVPGLMDATIGISHDEIAKLFFEKLQLEFPPGETWSYSNSAYLLLGNIVEKASGKTYWEFLDERIFKPFGMRASRSSEPRAIVPRRAAGYEWRGDHLENRPAVTENAYAAGSIVSTVQDLAKWDAALTAGKVPRLDLMWAPNEARGRAIAPFNYGFGWFVDTWHGRRLISHAGGTPGFSSLLYRFMDDRLTVIVLTNHTDRVLDHLAVDIAGLYVPALARPTAERADPDPERSRMLREILLGLFEGRHDPARFTPAMQTFLKTTVGKGIWGWTAADGPMKSFTFSESEKGGDAHILRYKAVLGNVTRWFSFTLTGDGRVAQVFWW